MFYDDYFGADNNDKFSSLKNNHVNLLTIHNSKGL